MISLTINGTAHEVDLDPAMPLLFFLRDHLELTGTKYGCGIGACGACTVLVDGYAARSCSLTLGALEGANISTIESVDGTEWEVVQEAWIDKQVPQCGYCQSGMIMATLSLLRDTPHPSPERIRASLTNLCRCGTYPRIEAAVLLAAQRLAAQRQAIEKAPPPKRRRRR